jgi:3-oxoacyl-[acyl-carrier protein] reductase
MNLTGRTALVTGGARGIGRATVLALARAGADVAVNYRVNKTAADSVVAAVQELGRKALAIQADVRSADQIKAMFDRIDESFGRLDILINNAATGQLIPLEDVTVDFWDDIMNVDLRGPFLCTQAAALRMIPARYGRIVNISSLGGVHGIDRDPAYTAAKAGLLGFTKSAARYLGPHNITVNSVSPGATDTELSSTLPREMHERAAAAAALRRTGKPEDVADVILFFASDYSRHVTGQMILVDGGIAMP